MNDDPATDGGDHGRADLRRRHVAMAGHRHSPNAASVARRRLDDPDPRVREAALGALARLGALTAADVAAALAEGPVRVRRRAVDAAVSVRGAGSRSVLPTALVRALQDPDALVVIGAAWFLGERHHRPAVPELVEIARTHSDARCREAAVAALGAIGERSGLPAVLRAAHEDRPTVRRRATVALAGFEDDRVEPALRSAAADRDWQVRQAAQELLGDPRPGRPE